MMKEHNEAHMIRTAPQMTAALLHRKEESLQVRWPKTARKQGVGDDFRYLYWE